MTAQAIQTIYRSGDWVVVECPRGVTFSTAAVLREAVESQRDPGWTGVIIDLGEVSVLDPNALKILTNFYQSMRQTGRAAGLVVRNALLRDRLSSFDGYIILPDLARLKRAIHEITPERDRLLASVGKRTSNLLSFTLRCPLCRCETVKGWMPRLEGSERRWFTNEITPQLVWEGEEETLDAETYSIAVCPECLFASSRLDWFDMPVHGIHSTLHDDVRDRLAKNSLRRRMMLSNENLEGDMTLVNYLGMPRLRAAARFAWGLSADALQVVGKDSPNLIDSLGVGLSYIMQARFAPEGADLKPYYSAAYIWLKMALKHPESYAEDRMEEASVYL